MCLKSHIDNIQKMYTVNNTLTFFFSPATLKTVCVPAGDNVLVPCPDSTREDMKYDVYRNNEIIFTYNYNRGSNGSMSGPLFVRVGMKPYQNAKDTLVGFMLTRVNISSRGIYRCEGTVTYPPPLLPLPSQQWILVLIEGKYSYHQGSIYNLTVHQVQSTLNQCFLVGHQCNLTCNNATISEDQDGGFHWKWILALVVLYSIIATICATYYWVS